MLVSNSTNTVWLDTLFQIVNHGQKIKPRGKDTLELLHHTVCVDMFLPQLAVPGRLISYKFMAAEALWILSGSNRVREISPYNKNIAKFSDDGSTFYGAYGPRIKEQWAYCLGKLLEDPGTRQSVLTIWRENPPQTKDYPCTVAMNFQIREGKLHLHVFMRSSDVWLGLPYDIFNFTMLALKMCCDYNDPANEERALVTGIKLGNLYLTMGSSHLYMEDYQDALGIMNDCVQLPVQQVPLGPMLAGEWKPYEDSLIHCRDHIGRVQPSDGIVWGIRP